MEKPEIKRQEGFTTIEAVVTLDQGFGTLRGIVKFVKKCEKYERNIFFKKANETPNTEFKFNRAEYADGKSCIELMAIASGPVGTRIQAVVEGEDEVAEQMAMRLYSALTSKYSTDPDFSRYEV